MVVAGSVVGTTTTAINSSDTSLSNLDTINIGDANGVQDIQGNLVINGGIPLLPRRRHDAIE